MQNNRNLIFVDTIIRLIEDIVLSDPDPYIRYKIVELLCQRPPFIGITDPLQTTAFPSNSTKLANTLWYGICNSATENRIRLMLIDLYYQLYGKDAPIILKDRNNINASNCNGADINMFGSNSINGTVNSIFMR